MGSKPNPKAGGQQINEDVAAKAGDKQEAPVVQQDPVVKVEDADVKEKEEAPVIQAAYDDELLPTPKLPVAPQVTIAPTVVVEQPAKVEDKPVVVNATAVVDPKQELKTQIAHILRDVPGAYQTDINRVYTYLDRMAPGRPVSTDAGAKEQVALYKSIQNIVNRQEIHFTALFTSLLAIFKAEFKGALGDRYRLRFMESVVLGEGDRKAFNYLTHLLCVAADPVSRKQALKSINFDRALSNGVTPAGRDRILGYFDA